MLKDWDELPEYMRTEDVWPYYERLEKKKSSLLWKRVFDFVAACLLLIVLTPIMLFISVVIVIDSKGGVFFSQERVTQYGRKFKIFKFRTMMKDAEKVGSQVTVFHDMRITKVGRILRKYRLDELPQLYNILLGDMSFCGTRPEVTKYVKQYTPEMMATLLLPAGVTSRASIQYKDEERLLEAAEDVDEVYMKQVLPEKMKYNLENIRNFSFYTELITMLRTIFAVFEGENSQSALQERRRYKWKIEDLKDHKSMKPFIDKMQ